MQSRSTPGNRRVARKFAMRGSACCSSSSSLSSWPQHCLLSQGAFRGRSRTTSAQTNAQTIEGIPSKTNVICQPTALIRKPVTADIHKTVTGFPRMKIAFARDRSVRVNQFVSRIRMDGKITLSATPSSSRSSARSQNSRMTPVKAARTPQLSSAKNTSRVALLRRA